VFGHVASTVQWWTSWTQYHHFAAQGWSKKDGVVITEYTAFARFPGATGAFATPASGLTSSAKWWMNGTKQGYGGLLVAVLRRLVYAPARRG